MGRDLEGSGNSLLEILSMHFPGATEENCESPQSGRILSLALLENSVVLPSVYGS
jgi:hypothetical protein